MKPIFPKWMNALPTLMFFAVNSVVICAIAGMWYYATPKFWEVGYMPEQPGGGFNHQIHAGRLGMDCRYCHTNVEESWHANVPAVKTCYGCHAEGKLRVSGGADDVSKLHNAKTQFIRDAYDADKPIEWRNIHVVPDYANFPHNAHLNAGVSCYSCHGQIEAMPVVSQAESLSMGWCLDCHQNAEANLVPKERLTDLWWVENEWFSKPVNERQHEGKTPEELRALLMRDPPEHCSACHF